MFKAAVCVGFALVLASGSALAKPARPGLNPLLNNLGGVLNPFVTPVTSLTGGLVGGLTGTAASGALPLLGRLVAPLNNNLLSPLGRLTGGQLGNR